MVASDLVLGIGNRWANRPLACDIRWSWILDPMIGKSGVAPFLRQQRSTSHPYYDCLNAQRTGWATCPSKSLSAHAIEESVLNRLRDAQHAMFGLTEWEQMDRLRQVQAMAGIVERLGYDGAARQISIRFRAVGEQVSS